MLLPELAGVRHRFLTVDGIRLHIAEAGARVGPPVLLLHGFPQHWWMWRDVIPWLGGIRRVIALDFRGFGWSDAPQGGYSTAARVREVIGVLDALQIGKADVVGHDVGAWVATRLALEHPERINRAVAISMVHPWPMQRHLAPTTWRWWVTALFEIPLIGEWMMRTKPALTEWLLSRDARDRNVWTPELRAAYSSVAAEPDRARAARRLMMALIRNDIPRILLGRDRRTPCEIPILAISGDHDALVPPVVASVPRRRADILSALTLPGGHYLVDENPTGVADAILRFLGQESSSVARTSSVSDHLYSRERHESSRRRGGVLRQ